MHVSLSSLLGLKKPVLTFLAFSFGGIVVHQIFRKLGDRFFKRLMFTEFLLKAVAYTFAEKSLHSSPCKNLLICCC